MRAAALLHILAARVGAENPHQFAAHFDDKLGMPTRQPGKWRSNFSGEKPLSVQQKALLARLDPDAYVLHENGPAELWKAMWGRLDELPSIISSELKEWGTLDVTLTEFEADLLVAEQKRAPLGLAYLAKAISLYRLRQGVESIVPLGLDGEGICRCLRLCLDNDQVQQELSCLGVKQAVDAELTNWIFSHPDIEVAWAPAEARSKAISLRLNFGLIAQAENFSG